MRLPKNSLSCQTNGLKVNQPLLSKIYFFHKAPFYNPATEDFCKVARFATLNVIYARHLNKISAFLILVFTYFMLVARAQDIIRNLMEPKL